MKKIAFLSILTIISLLFACEQEVANVKLPPNPSKLVVTSFISPQDSILWVKIVQSVPVLGVRNTSNEYLEGLSVTMSDGAREVSLSRVNRSDTFAILSERLLIVAGQTYFLKVQAVDGRQAEASCTVPEAFPSTPEIELDSTIEQGGRYVSYNMRMSWEDIAGSTNYYRVAGEIRRVYRYSNNRGAVNWQPLYWDSGTSNIYISDAKLDGNRLISPKGMMGGNPPGGSGQEMTSSILYAYLLHTDYHYYQYHRSVYKAEISQDNPFAEPVLVYSNIQGGLGVFAAFNRKTVEVRIK
jgi:hypothetical protein